MIVRCRNAASLDRPFSAIAWSSPFGGLDFIRRELDHVLSRGTNTTIPEPFLDGALRPSALALEDHGSQFVLTAQVPGIEEKDLDITVTSDQLTVRGQRKVHLPDGYTKVRQERTTYAFDRTFQLPHRVDSSRVEAKLTNGTLTVSLPKIEAAQPRRICIRSA